MNFGVAAFGLQLVESPYVSEFTDVPVRKHRGREQTAYSRRIQKKWNKRFGVTSERQILSDGERIICHPRTAEAIRAKAERVCL